MPEHEFSLKKNPEFSHILGSIISESSVNSFKLKIHFECLLNTDYCSKYIGVCNFFQKIFFSNVQHRLICCIQEQFCQLYI